MTKDGSTMRNAEGYKFIKDGEKSRLNVKWQGNNEGSWIGSTNSGSKDKPFQHLGAGY